jgi:hypothetical protein
MTDIPHEVDLTSAKREWDHEVFFGNAARFDLGKLQEQAEERARGDYYASGVTTLLHFHAYQERCEGAQHKGFKPIKEEM